MKIIIPTNDRETIAVHTRRCLEFAIYEIEEREIISQEFVKNHCYDPDKKACRNHSEGCNHEQMLQIFKNADIIIYYVMGKNLRKELEENRIQYHKSRSVYLKEILKEFILLTNMYQKDFWNDCYSQEKFIYGTLPNEYLREKLKELLPGKILFPAEGEGRNVVYAAQIGWKSDAFDQSEEGKKKALLLAKEKNVEISYNISDVENIDYTENSFDTLALVYAHFPEAKRRKYHKKLGGFLKLGGSLILEGFSKMQKDFQEKNPGSGGPKDITMLYDLEELKQDFHNFEFKEAFQKEIILNEGDYHRGKASVIRIFAIKK